MQKKNGFTLIELLITVALVAILATIAAPSFSRVIQGSQLSAHANDLLAAVAYARSEAIKRGTTISLCPVGGDLQNGAEVRLGNGCTGAVLRAATPGTGITATTNFSGNYIPLAATGLVALDASDLPKSGGEVIDIEVQLSKGRNNRWLCLSRTGRAYISREAACNSV